MIFSVVIILLIGIIAYFHVVQGLFSSIISLVCALIASLMAISFHEQLAAKVFASKMSDQGTSLTLAVLFVAIYLVLRVLFDNLIPGNVRLPAIVDKVGGAIVGALAGALAAAILCIAAQALPFGAPIFGYARYTLEAEREVKIPPSGSGQMQDTIVFDAMKSDLPTAESAEHMLLPVDDWFLSLVQQLSAGGSLAGDRKFSSVHPAYLDELFFQRVGVQGGGKHVLVNTEKEQAFKVQPPLRTVDQLGATSAEIPEIRANKDNKPVRSDPLHALLVVRVLFADTAADTDHLVRLAPGAVRMVAGEKNYYPIGTLENGGLYQNNTDDFLFITPNLMVDFVFLVDRENAIDGSPAPGAKPSAANPMTVKRDVFIEIKRMARAPLSGLQIDLGVPAEPSTGVMRKNNLKPPDMVTTAVTTAAPSVPTPPAAPATPGDAAPTPPETPDTSAPAAPASGGPVNFVSAAATTKLFVPINVGKHGADAADLKFNSGTAVTKGGKLAKFEVHPTDPLDVVSKGDDAVSDIAPAEGTHAVIVTVDAGSSAWDFATDLSSFELVDTTGIPYKPNGALAKVTKAGKEYLVGAYNADEPVEKIEKQDGTPTRIAIIFLIPDKTPLAALNFKGQKIADVSIK